MTTAPQDEGSIATTTCSLLDGPLLAHRYSDEMELEDAIHTALLTLKEGFEGQITAENIEVAIVDQNEKFRVLTCEQVRDYLEEVE